MVKEKGFAHLLLVLVMLVGLVASVYLVQQKTGFSLKAAFSESVQEVNFNLEDAINQAKPGDIVTLPVGIITTKPINIQKSIKLIGAGVDSQGNYKTIIRLFPGSVPVNSNFVPVIRFENTSQVLVKDLAIDDSEDPNKGFALSFWNVSDSTIENVSVKNANHFGFHLQSSQRITVSNSSAESISYQGIVASDSDNCQINNFKAKNIKGPGIVLGSSQNCRVSKADIRHSKQGIIIVSGVREANNNIVEDSYVDYEPTGSDFISEAGIVVIGTQGMAAKGNKIRNNKVANMNSVYAHNYSEDTLIDSNVIYAARASGTGTDGQRTTITNNLILDASRGVGDLDPNDNIDYSNVDIGIEVDTGFDHIIKNNVVFDSEIYKNPCSSNPLLTKWGIADYDSFMYSPPFPGGDNMEVSENYIFFPHKGSIRLIGKNNKIGPNYTDPSDSGRLTYALNKIKEAGYGNLVESASPLVCKEIPPGANPSCSGVSISSLSTYATDGSFDVYAEGVKSADLVWFGVWSEDRGQDDLAWYSGEKKAGGLWAGHIDLAKHSGIGPITVMAFANTKANPTPGKGASCGTTSFTRVSAPAPISVDNPSPAKFTEVHPSSPTTKATSGTFDIIATGATNTDMVWFGAWTLTNQIDDLKWYQGINQGSGNWVGKIDLSKHTGIDTIFVRACATNKAFPQINADTICKDTSFQRVVP